MKAYIMSVWNPCLTEEHKVDGWGWDACQVDTKNEDMLDLPPHGKAR